MSAKLRMIMMFQTMADETGDNEVRIAFGAPGEHLVNAIDEIRPTGQSWKDLDKGTWPLCFGALAAHFHGVRRIDANGDLVVLDSIVELGSNSITLSLPAASDEFIGRYVVKAVGTTGTGVSGLIDGSSGTLSVVGYEVLRVYCNGTEWLTW